MSKDTFFFRHDYNARNDHKTSALISDYGATGYGIYWCLIEMLHEESEHKLPLEEYFYRSTAKQTSTSVEQVLNVVKDCLEVYKLFSEENGFFFSKRVFKNISDREDIRAKRSIAGKISAEKRAKNNSSSTSVEQNSTKKRKGKERKEKDIDLTHNEIVNLELSELEEEDKLRWVKFTGWFKDSQMENVPKITKQLTPKQLVKLLKDFGASEIKDTLLRMENYKKSSSYTSVYLTLNNWLKKEAATV